MFNYRPLDSQGNEVRLVRISHPVDPESPVALELRHAHIGDDDAPRFSALSYLWGDVTSTIEVQVNGKPFSLGHNLYAALEALRRNNVRSWLWVDSVCINQLDLEEKAWHVNDMRTIYSRADIVYIWLGPGSDQTDMAMDFLSRIGPQAVASGGLDLWYDRELGKEIRAYLQAQPPAQNNLGGSDLKEFIYGLLQEKGLRGTSPYPPGYVSEEGALVPGINDLLQKDYWHRIWVIQEVALAKDGVVICGDKSAPLDFFDATFTVMSYCFSWKVAAARPEYDGFCWGLSGTLYNIAPIVTRGQRRLNRVRLVDILVQYGAPPERPFYSASDPRDIVFGLLGVIDDGEELGLRADYRRTLAEVFADATRALIRDADDSRGSARFHLDHCVPRRRNAGGLPTWVPDWRDIGRHGLRPWPVNYFDAFNAAAGMLPTTSSECGNPAVLRRLGCYVDKITEVMPPPYWIQFDEWSASQIADADAWLASVFEFAGLGAETGPGEDHVWRTIMRGRLTGVNPRESWGPDMISEGAARLVRRLMRRERVDVESLTEEQAEFVLGGPFRLGRNRWPGLETLGDKLAYLADKLPKWTGTRNRERTLFKTVKGMFGLGHVAARPGDAVTLLWGVRSPLVLRRRDGEGEGFLLMGDAYVDGIMNGEFLKTNPAEREFDIY